LPIYDVWNNALIDYLTTGVPRGSSVFLDINDDVLEDIGRRTFAVQSNSSTRWVDDFKRAVRAKCVVGTKIHLENLPTYRADDASARPQGVAFLGAMVLAAYYMGEDEETSSINYFKRLRDILYLDEDGEANGRPKSMKAGSEEHLWAEWGVWLQRQGFLPTAQRGEGSKTYINYPISQSLLRRADRDRLERLFEERTWPKQLDQNIVAARIRRELPYQSKHLQQLLQEGSVQRFQALVEAIFEVYENWVSFGRSTTRRREIAKYVSKRNMSAGLYRTSDPLLSTVEYSLYPRQPRRFRPVGLQVKHLESFEKLVEDGPKWYRPLWTLGADELENGAQYELIGSSDFQYLVIPKRDFWILTLDPDYPESGVYISAESLDLGASFTLLCKQDLQNQITRLKNERLVQWRSDPHPLTAYPGWIEYREMMVLSEAWSGVSRAIENRDLYESLRPLSSISIRFEAGLRVPRTGAWLEGYGPRVVLVAFDDKAHLTMQVIGRDTMILDKEVPTNSPLSLEWPGPGDYFLEASVGNKSTAGIVKIIPWNQLTMSTVEKQERTKIGLWSVYGALVRSADVVS